MDRSQIILNDNIGVGQFGDVHIGTCKIKQKSTPQKNNLDDDGDSVSSLENSESKMGIIHVAVKTCKADADLVTSEKFLEEACKSTHLIKKKIKFLKLILIYCVPQISCKSLNILTS